MDTRIHRGSLYPKGNVPFILMLFFTMGYADLFCPSAILDGPYLITGENYNTNISDLDALRVTWYFEENILSDCNISSCVQPNIDDYPDKTIKYNTKVIGATAIQFQIIIAKFATNLQGEYAVMWQSPGNGAQMEKCTVKQGEPVDECTTTKPCVYSTLCKDLQSGYECSCLSGYGGQNCNQGDLKLYCDYAGYVVRFSPGYKGCTYITIICYVAGIESEEDTRITSKQTANTNPDNLSAVATVINNNVTFRVCVEATIAIGDHQISYTLESDEALASYDFTIEARVAEINTPPRFNFIEYSGLYLINVLENVTLQSTIMFVNKSMTPTCSDQNYCIQVVDGDVNQTKGMDSLSLDVKLESSQTASISYQDSKDPYSLGYFYVTGQLAPGTEVSYSMTVADGDQATDNANVTFHILDVNQTPVCSQVTVKDEFDIRTQPIRFIGAISCTDPDSDVLFRTISYSVEAQYADYFCVSENGTLFLCRSVLGLGPGLLTFVVRAQGYSEVPDSSYVFDIPVNINLTVPAPTCNLTITAVPGKWEINSTAELKLQCDDSGVDNLLIASWNYSGIFGVSPMKYSPTSYKISLTVKQYRPAIYDFEITVTLGGPTAPVSVEIQVCNPPEFSSPTSTEIMDTAPVGVSFFYVEARTDTNDLASITLKSGDPHSLFSLNNGLLSPAKSLSPHAGTVWEIVVEAEDLVCHVKSESTLTVSIKDTNEPPVCLPPVYTVTLYSNNPPGSSIISVGCTDPDITPEFHDLSYTIRTDLPTVHLGIDNNGSVTLLEALPAGVVYVHVVVNVSDITFSTLATIDINIVVVKCPRDTTVFGLVFAETPVYSIGTASCSDISPIYSGQVSRSCSLNQTWGLFNHTACRRIDLQATANTVNQLKTNPAPTVDNVMLQIKIIANDLRASVDKTSVILSGDITQMVGIISGVGEITQMYEKATIDSGTLENFAICADSLIGAEVRMWTEALEEKVEEGAILLEGMDAITSASLRTEQLDTDNPIVKANIAIKRASSSDDIVFPDSEDPMYHDYEGWVLESNNTALLRSEAFSSSHGQVKYSVILYHNASAKFRINPDIQNDRYLQGKVLNSDILCFTIAADIPVLSPPLQVSFSILQTSYSNPSCGYLNTNSSEAGVWSSSGCTAAQIGDRIQCSCNHLTNFALLMSPFGDVSRGDDMILSIISAVGCGISIFCLLITIVVYMVLWKYVKCDRSVLHMNLSVCLILAYIIFLAGVDRTDNVIGCKVVAVLLHYIYLAVFCIMLCEGIEIFKSVSFVFSSDSILCKLIPLSYGVPLIIVAISLGVTKTEGYGSKTSCWLSTKDGLIWAFVGPVLLILLINFVILIQVLRTMQNTRQMVSKTAKERSKSVVRTICILSPILGITWMFGVLSVNSETVVFQYLFAIMNSLQGVTIFICYCLLTHQVQDGFLALRRKHRAKSFDSRQNLSSSTPDLRGKPRTHSLTEQSANPSRRPPFVSSPSTTRTATGQSNKTTLTDITYDGGQHSIYSGSHGNSTVTSRDSLDWWKNDALSQQAAYEFRNTMDPDRRHNQPIFDAGSVSHTSFVKNGVDSPVGHTNFAFYDSMFTEANGDSVSATHGRQDVFHPQNLTQEQNRARDQWRKIRDVAIPPAGPVSPGARAGPVLPGARAGPVLPGARAGPVSPGTRAGRDMRFRGYEPTMDYAGHL